jgi:WD40 repeat protein
VAHALIAEGKYLACVSEKRRVTVWEAATGREALEFRAGEGAFGRLFAVPAFSLDGRRLAAPCPADASVKVWDVMSGQLLLSVPAPGKPQNFGPVVSVALSPDGGRLFAASQDGHVTVWETLTRKEVAAYQVVGGIGVLSPFSPDARTVRVRAAGRFTLCAAETGARVVSLPAELTGFPVQSLGGQLIAAGDGTQIQVRDATASKLICRVPGRRALAFSPDGRRLVTDEGGVTVWDVPSGRQVAAVRGVNLPTASFSPDGTRLACSGGGTAVLCDVTSWGAVTTSFDHLAWGFALSPDGGRLAVAAAGKGNGGTVEILDALTGRVVLRLPYRAAHRSARRLAFSPGGERLAAAGGGDTTKVWDARTGDLLATLEADCGDGDNGIVFSPDGRFLAGRSAEGTIKLWDAKTYQEARTLEGSAQYDCGPVFSPDSRRLVSGLRGVIHPGPPRRVRGGSQADYVKVWDVETGKEMLALPPPLPNLTLGDVAFSRDGRIVASVGNKVKVWDATTGEVLPFGEVPANRGVFALGPGGDRLATVVDGEVKIWDARTAQEVLTLRGPPIEVVRGLAFTPDGTRLVMNHALPEKIVVWDGSPMPQEGHGPGR